MTAGWNVLVGQHDSVATLQRAVADARLTPPGTAMTHAWLIIGPPGAGRSTAALLFAAALQCDTGGCGTCRACREVSNDAHPDVVRFNPQQLQITVDEARGLMSRACLSPDRGTWTVMIVEDADRLNEVSGNMLLKAIEEPTPHTVWLLCAPSTEDVLPTIRSRCRVLGLRTPPWREVAGLLEAGGIEPSMAAFAARAAQGHVGRARALALDEDARIRRQHVLRIPMELHNLPACFAAAADIVATATADANSYTGPLDTDERDELLRAYGEGSTGSGITKTRIERLAKGAVKELEGHQKSRRTRAVRDRLDRALVDLLTFYRDVLVLQVGAGVDLVNEELRPTLQRVAAESSPESSRRRLDAISRTRRLMESNASPQLLLEGLTVELARG
ncbi:MAG: DNA polymerase III subunit delta' [Actinobacteria bacterium]|uniref:Unannotated protein n=1 Tax=freshwater metagenome TaxID=449393 RepID=A0A6J7PFT9_9ZZZZ|nr:DNA polymerase III subunit delta' [Actinomycetota bacterium]